MGKKLTQDVFNGLQKSYRYAAVDGSGRAYAYTCKPVLSDIFFMPDDSPVNSDYLNLQDYYDATNWQNSLIERQIDVMQAIADKLVGGWQESCDNSKKDQGICEVTDWKVWVSKLNGTLENQSKEIAKRDEAIKSLNEKIKSLNNELHSQKLVIDSKLGDGSATINTLIYAICSLSNQVFDIIKIKNLEIGRLSHQIKEDGLLIDSLSHEIEALKKG